jgi:predicted DNA-binding transcriptional regulator AlpA
MAEITEMVTLTERNKPLKEADKLRTSADTKLSIHEAAKWSGYNPLSLRRLDKAAKPGFPPAHRDIGGTARFWYASEVEAIIAFKIKAAEEHKKFMTSGIHKLKSAGLRAARAAAVAAKKAAVAA